jgi:hypothetical protein
MLLLLVLFIAVVSASPLLPYGHACLAGALLIHACMHMRAGWAENQRTLELANKRHACYSPLPAGSFSRMHAYAAPGNVQSSLAHFDL